MRYFFLAAFSVCAVLAQVDAGGISGVVSDSSGAVIPGVRVQIVQENTNVRMDLATNASGFYSAPALRPGAYLIAVTKEGFRAERRTGIELRVQDRLEINFQLEVGTASTEVTVSASAPLLESETSSLGQVILEKTITDLPLNGRNFIQLATLGAGTLPSTRTAERDSFISNGARGVQNSYLLDGVDNRNRIMGFDKSSAQIVQPVVGAIPEPKESVMRNRSWFLVVTVLFTVGFAWVCGPATLSPVGAADGDGLPGMPKVISTRPSSVSASLRITNGRRAAIQTRHASFCARAAAKSACSVSTPAARRSSRPPPILGFGSSEPATTLATPAASTAFVHGGVEP